MSTVKKISGTAIASIAAGMILSGCETMDSDSAAASEASEAKVHCHGVNACKGMTACATADNSCKGQNACKGAGWMPMSEGECEAEGGKVEG